MKKNVAGQKVGVQMTTAADGTNFTGAVTVSVTGDAGTQATGSVGAGACAHEGLGYHTYAPAQAETDYDLIAFTFTGSGAITTTLQVYTSFPQTGDGFGRLGAPAGASVSADVAAVKVDTAAILVDTGTTLDGRLPAALVSGRMDSSVGAMAANVLTATAINADAITAAKVAADVSAEIADAVWDEDATAHQTTGTFGQAIGDPVADTNTIYKAVVTDAAGATVGVDVVAAKADTAAILVDTADMQPKLGTPAGASISADIAAIEAQTDDIGAAGAGLTAVPWNASWDAEVQSEATDALNAYDPPTNAEMEARTIAAASYATAAALAIVDDFLDTEIAAILAAVDTEVSAILALLDDARGEPGQGNPPVNPDVVTKVDYLFKWMRNKKDNDGSTTKFYADDGATVDQKQTTSEAAGTVTKGEIVTGP